ncbi:MAG: hypothetical protein ABI759_26110 [Candidatus Solibacter sp.]
MKRFVFGLLLVTACFGQGKGNVVQTGVVDARGATWVPPTARFANQPSSPVAGSVYVFTDAAALGSCSGGGSALATCRWSGSDWQAVGGGGSGAGSQASIFSGGALVQRQVECASGTVPYSALTAAGTTQEITIQTGIPGNVRWDQVLISESTQFAGTPALSVSMGRPGTNNNIEMSGVAMPLKSSGGDASYWSTRPIPPQVIGTYSVVLNFSANSNLGNGSASNFTAGAVTWEVCGYAAR